MPALYDSIDPPFNPGEFDYKSYLANHQVYYQAFLNQRQIHLVAQDQGNTFVSFALKLRKELVDKFYRYLQDKDAAAFASTLILGYRAELSRELVEAYSKTGTMHVLSVSGMHVGIVFMVLSVVLKFMNKTQSTRLIRALLIILIIWFYALLTGFSAPACRASFMLSFIVLGKALNKTQNTYNLIAISAFFLLLYNPFYLVDAGFQLSYLAVTGLVYFHPKIYQALYVKNKLLDYVWSYCALSMAAQLATFPFSIYYFHQFPIYFLLSNLFIVFPVAIIMYAGILFLFIPFPVVLYHVGQTLSWLIDFTNRILYYIENLPFSSYDGIWINLAECVLICLFIICMCLGVTYGYRKLILPISILLILVCSSFSWNWIEHHNHHEIVFYNLRRKTGIAYVFKGRSIIISDVDHSDKLMSFSILPAVKSKGSREEIFYPVNKGFSGSSYLGEQNFYQFGYYRILRWDKTFENIKFSKTLTVDALLISGNPRITVDQIASCLNFARIIIDGNNPDYKIEGWVTEARKMNIPYYVLKKNPALTINL
jgi:competence protein ComEC